MLWALDCIKNLIPLQPQKNQGLGKLDSNTK